MQKKLSYATLIFIYAYWGITTVLMKHALIYMNSTTYILLRYGCAAFFVLLFFYNRLKGIGHQLLIKGAILGLLSLLPLELSVFGMNYTSASNSAFISQLSIVFVPCMIYLKHRQYPPRSFLCMLILVLFGLLVFSNILEEGINLGDAITFIGMLVNSISILLIERFCREENPIQLGLLQTLFAFALSFIFALPYKIDFVINSQVMIILVLSGMVGTGVLYMLQILAQRHVSSISVSLISIISPIFGMIGASMIPNEYGALEQITSSKLIGATIIISSLLSYFIYIFLKKSSVRNTCCFES